MSNKHIFVDSYFLYDGAVCLQEKNLIHLCDKQTWKSIGVFLQSN